MNLFFFRMLPNLGYFNTATTTTTKQNPKLDRVTFCKELWRPMRRNHECSADITYHNLHAVIVLPLITPLKSSQVGVFQPFHSLVPRGIPQGIVPIDSKALKLPIPGFSRVASGGDFSLRTHNTSSSLLLLVFLCPMHCSWHSSRAPLAWWQDGALLTQSAETKQSRFPLCQNPRPWYNIKHPRKTKPGLPRWGRTSTEGTGLSVAPLCGLKPREARAK